MENDVGAQVPSHRAEAYREVGTVMDVEGVSPAHLREEGCEDPFEKDQAKRRCEAVPQPPASRSKAAKTLENENAVRRKAPGVIRLRTDDNRIRIVSENVPGPTGDGTAPVVREDLDISKEVIDGGGSLRMPYRSASSLLRA
ncbi:MAG: hypothetical protein NVSMB3_07540 [Acidobacteriaceae bacterium]